MQDLILIKKGAEAELFKSEFLGKKVLIKKRVSKKYRRKELDEKIRIERNKREAVLLHKAKIIGVRTPIVYRIDSEKKELVMEFIEGNRLKDELNEKNLNYCFEFGKIVAKLHNANIIHGDLTTSNMLVQNSGSSQLVLIDFGLAFESNKLEDKAVDLLNLKKTFLATHFNLMIGWDKFLDAYKKETGFNSIESKLDEIEKRARYH